MICTELTLQAVNGQSEWVGHDARIVHQNMPQQFAQVHARYVVHAQI